LSPFYVEADDKGRSASITNFFSLRDANQNVPPNGGCHMQAKNSLVSVTQTVMGAIRLADCPDPSERVP